MFSPADEVLFVEWLGAQVWFHKLTVDLSTVNVSTYWTFGQNPGYVLEAVMYIKCRICNMMLSFLPLECVELLEVPQ